MKLISLTLTNFRGFEQIEIVFADDLTVIAGVNGIGKSSLLSAAAVVASHLLPFISHAKQENLELTSDDIHADKPALTSSALWMTAGGPFNAQVVRSVGDPSKTEGYQQRRDQIRRDLREVTKGSKEEVELNEEIRYLGELLRPEADHFSYQGEGAASTYLARIREFGEPLVIHYSTERYFRGMPKKLLDVKPLSASDANTDALSGKEVKLNDFANWFRFVQAGEDARFGKQLLGMLDKAITTLLPGFSGLQLVQGTMPHFTVVKAGKTMKLGQLSDGEQGLLALVFDLTRRLAIANPKTKNPLVEGVAVVLIDEIELHLHPTWQRQVLRHLQEIFPGCQFVYTTHSPQVIGQVKPEKLRLLHPDSAGKVGLHLMSQSFGMDSSWILQNIMGCPVREYKVEQKLSVVFDLIDAGKYPAARKAVTALQNEVGMFPELQEADSLLDRMKLLSRK